MWLWKSEQRGWVRFLPADQAHFNMLQPIPVAVQPQGQKSTYRATGICSDEPSHLWVSDREIRISRPKAALAQSAAVFAKKGELVPAFAQEWCTQEDSNL